MSVIYKLKNNSGAEGTWGGQVIADGEWHVIDQGNLEVFRADVQVMQDVAAGDLIVGNESMDFTGDPIGGWNYLEGDHMPKSELDGLKIAVHSSPKPYVPGKRTYAVWTGCGDDVDGDDIGDGPMVSFTSEVGVPDKHVDVKFIPEAGRVWIHEGYLAFDGGGPGDHMTSDIRATATLLQQSVALDLELVDNGKGSNWVVPASGGAGTGTHGFAATPVLLPRSFSHDGYWNWDGTNLTPAPAQDGDFNICDAEMVVHRYINRIPTAGSSYGYFTMSSNETTELPQGYYMRICQKNVSDTVWTASVIMEIYRERTHDP